MQHGVLRRSLQHARWLNTRQDEDAPVQYVQREARYALITQEFVFEISVSIRLVILVQSDIIEMSDIMGSLGVPSGLGIEQYETLKAQVSEMKKAFARSPQTRETAPCTGSTVEHDIEFLRCVRCSGVSLSCLRLSLSWNETHCHCMRRKENGALAEKLRQMAERAARERNANEKLKKTHAAALARLQRERQDLVQSMEEEMEATREKCRGEVQQLRERLEKAVGAAEEERACTRTALAQAHTREVRFVGVRTSTFE